MFCYVSFAVVALLASKQGSFVNRGVVKLLNRVSLLYSGVRVDDDDDEFDGDLDRKVESDHNLMIHGREPGKSAPERWLIMPVFK